MVRPRLELRNPSRPLHGMSFVLFVLSAWGCAGETRTDPAVEVVAPHLAGNRRDIEVSSLQTMPNPKGEGTLVYVPEENAQARSVVWLVIDAEAYALNGRTKGTITPTLPWPREAPPGVWDRTGLNPYTATEALEIIRGAHQP